MPDVGAQQGRGPVRVLVVDDHPMWREGVRADLEREGGFLVVAQAADGAAAVTAARLHRPDLVLLDLSMPGMSGSEAIGRLLADAPSTRVLVLSASGEAPDVLDAVKAGASGYLLKSATADELRAAAAQVVAGEPVFSPTLAALVLGEFRRVASGGGSGDAAGAPPPEGTARLTERETEVLRYVAKGYAYREVAEHLVISVRTVQNHVQSIFRKLQVSSRYELMRLAMERGLDHGR
jgi:DNA-binding NarL/FixJ family response regulator